MSRISYEEELSREKSSSKWLTSKISPKFINFKIQNFMRHFEIDHSGNLVNLEMLHIEKWFISQLISSKKSHF